jgi:hypothetical protein
VQKPQSSKTPTRGSEADTSQLKQKDHMESMFHMVCRLSPRGYLVLTGFIAERVHLPASIVDL